MKTQVKAPAHSTLNRSSTAFQTRPFAMQNESTVSEEHDGSSLFERYLQRRAAGVGMPSTSPIIQRQENNTGLPDQLKTGIESFSGYAMDDVSVHYNSAKPAQLQALAYTQGTDIHVAPGQERHLPHEAWHVVQQMEGRVRPTMQMKGVGLNDDVGLEHEADAMGTKALQMHPAASDRIGQTMTAMPRKSEPTRASEVPNAAIGASGDKGRLNFLSTSRANIYSALQGDKLGSGGFTDNRPAAKAAMGKTSAPAAIGGKGKGTVIQQYTETKKYRVSDNKNLAIAKDADRPKVYYSTDQLFKLSQEKLEELESPVELVKGPQNKDLPGSLFEVRAIQRTSPQAQHPLTQSECIEVAAEILKSGDTGKWTARIAQLDIDLEPYQLSSIQALIHPIVTHPSQPTVGKDEFGSYIDPIDEDMEIASGPRQAFLKELNALDSTNYPEELKEAITDSLEDRQISIHKAMLFFKYLKEDGDKGEFASINDEDDADHKIQPLLKKVEQDYARFFSEHSSKEGVAAGYGINEKAVAELGEALVILSTRDREQNRDQWNFHFATTIAKDGDDFITMENETNSQSDPVGYWAFKMYGSQEGQSFHKAHNAQNPLTVRVVPREK